MVEVSGQNMQDFLGAWKLVSVETRKEDGEVHRRGERVGYLLYNDEGYMSVAFMKRDRPEFASGDIRGGTVEEKVAAVEGYTSYCGRYEELLHRLHRCTLVAGLVYTLQSLRS